MTNHRLPLAILLISNLVLGNQIILPDGFDLDFEPVPIEAPLKIQAELLTVDGQVDLVAGVRGLLSVYGFDAGFLPWSYEQTNVTNFPPSADELHAWLAKNLTRIGAAGFFKGQDADLCKDPFKQESWVEQANVEGMDRSIHSTSLFDYFCYMSWEAKTVNVTLKAQLKVQEDGTPGVYVFDMNGALMGPVSNGTFVQTKDCSSVFVKVPEIRSEDCTLFCLDGGDKVACKDPRTGFLFEIDVNELNGNSDRTFTKCLGDHCYSLQYKKGLKNYSGIELSGEEIAFLQHYGYLPHEEDLPLHILTTLSAKKAIESMQEFGSLPVTGDLDEDTKKLMTAPRCGCADIIKSHCDTIEGRGWQKRNITYGISNELDKINYGPFIRLLIASAFKVWADEALITFTEIFSIEEADITITFGTLDGKGGALAHAVHTSRGCDIVIDQDEGWTIMSDGNDDDKKDVFQVLIHQIGHGLGLRHSPHKGSIMFPYYSKDFDRLHPLQEEDVAVIEHLYGKDEEKPILSSDSENNSTRPFKYFRFTSNGTTYYLKGWLKLQGEENADSPNNEQMSSAETIPTLMDWIKLEAKMKDDYNKLNYRIALTADQVNRQQYITLKLIEALATVDKAALSQALHPGALNNLNKVRSLIKDIQENLKQE